MQPRAQRARYDASSGTRQRTATRKQRRPDYLLFGGRHARRTSKGFLSFVSTLALQHSPAALGKTSAAGGSDLKQRRPDYLLFGGRHARRTSKGFLSFVSTLALQHSPAALGKTSAAGGSESVQRAVLRLLNACELELEL